MVELVIALRWCHAMFREEKARAEGRTQWKLEEDEEWRHRKKAFEVICDPKKAPCIEECTATNFDRCVDLLMDCLPADQDNLISYENDKNGFPPRPGSGIPSHYVADDLHECILGYHPPGD